VRRAFADADVRAWPNKVTATKVGFLVRAAIAGGGSQEQLVRAAPVLKTSLDVRTVTVIPDPDRGKLVTLSITERDPFTVPVIPWPNADRRDLSIWEPIPLGLDPNGLQVDLLLANASQGARSLLICGETGSGKSVALAIIVATAHRSRDVKRTWLADGTELDSDHWRPHVHRYVGADRGAMAKMLQQVVAAMDERKAELLQEGKVRVAKGDPVDLIVVDELPFFVNAPAGSDKVTKDQREHAGVNKHLLADVARRGRKFGFVLVVIAQRPTVDAIPADLREMLTYRLVFRLKTREGVVAGLGGDLVADGWDTTTVRSDQLGVGVLDAQASSPTWLKGFFLDPERAVLPSGDG
jgi:hypothetical protein